MTEWMDELQRFFFFTSLVRFLFTRFFVFSVLCCLFSPFVFFSSIFAFVVTCMGCGKSVVWRKYNLSHYTERYNGLCFPFSKASTAVAVELLCLFDGEERGVNFV